MLKKKEWLKKWKDLMIKSNEFQAIMIQINKDYAENDYKKELSPMESVNGLIDIQDKLQLVFGRL